MDVATTLPLHCGQAFFWELVPRDSGFGSRSARSPAISGGPRVSLTRDEPFGVSAVCSYFEALVARAALTYRERWMASRGAVVFRAALAPGVQHLVEGAREATFVRLGNARCAPGGSFFSLEAV